MYYRGISIMCFGKLANIIKGICKNKNEGSDKITTEPLWP